MKIYINNKDPARMLTLRKSFITDMNKRFRSLNRTIKEELIDENSLGLIDRKSSLTNNARPKIDKSVIFKRDSAKHQAFMEWLHEMIRTRNEFGKPILEITRGTPLTTVDNRAWTDLYIQSAYRKGMGRADTELNKIGVETGDFNINTAFNQPFHADRVALLYTRTFSELKGITARMEQKVSRALAQGMAEGKNGYEVSRMLRKRVDIERKYANMLCRTELQRAHHVATINVYRQAGIEGVEVQVEWLTAGDNRVCPICMDFATRTYTLDEIEPLIPAHPNCRCVSLPLTKNMMENK